MNPSDHIQHLQDPSLSQNTTDSQLNSSDNNTNNTADLLDLTTPSSHQSSNFNTSNYFSTVSPLTHNSTSRTDSLSGFYSAASMGQSNNHDHDSMTSYMTPRSHGTPHFARFSPNLTTNIPSTDILSSITNPNTRTSTDLPSSTFNQSPGLTQRSNIGTNLHSRHPSTEPYSPNPSLSHHNNTDDTSQSSHSILESILQSFQIQNNAILQAVQESNKTNTTIFNKIYSSSIRQENMFHQLLEHQKSLHSDLITIHEDVKHHFQATQHKMPSSPLSSPPSLVSLHDENTGSTITQTISHPLPDHSNDDTPTVNNVPAARLNQQSPNNNNQIQTEQRNQPAATDLLSSPIPEHHAPSNTPMNQASSTDRLSSSIEDCPPPTNEPHHVPPPANQSDRVPEVPNTISIQDTSNQGPSSLDVQEDRMLKMMSFLQEQNNKNMLIMAETLTSNFKAITDKQDNEKLAFPELKDVKQFPHWWSKCMNLLSSDKWSSLYDPTTRMPSIEQCDSAGTKLNEKLYTIIMNKLNNSLNIQFTSMQHLVSDGVGLLHAIHRKLLPPLTAIDIDNKCTEFNTLIRKKDESIDNYYMRREWIRHHLKANECPINKPVAIQRFIMGLGDHFKDIQLRLSTHDLPAEWKVKHVHELIPIANSYKQSVQEVQKLQSNKDSSSTKSDWTEEQSGHKTKILALFSSKKMTKSIEGQYIKRFPTGCYYHQFKPGDKGFHLHTACQKLNNLRQKHGYASDKTKSKDPPDTTTPPPKNKEVVIKEPDATKVTAEEHDTTNTGKPKADRAQISRTNSFQGLEVVDEADNVTDFGKINFYDDYYVPSSFPKPSTKHIPRVRNVKLRDSLLPQSSNTTISYPNDNIINGEVVVVDSGSVAAG